MSPMRPSLLLIRLASWLVPVCRRTDWRLEWEAEIQHAQLRVSDGKLVRFAWGSLRDAALYRWQLLERERLVRDARRNMESPAFCLSALLSMIAIIALASGFLPATRAVLLPLPYREAAQIATVSQGGGLVAVRSRIRGDWVRLWRKESALIQDLATYTWNKENWIDPAGRSIPVLNASVSGNFFSLLGGRTTAGRILENRDLAQCRDCAVLSYAFWRRVSYANQVTVNGKRYEVAAVMEPDFWFLSHDVGIWTPVSETAARTGVVLRLHPEVSKFAARAELESILRDAGVESWASLVDVMPVQDRVRSVLFSYGFALGLAMIITTIGLHLRLPNFNRGDLRLAVQRGFRQVLFFCVKTVLLLAAVLLLGLEFTKASSINMTGGTDLSTEPFSTWMFMMACAGALTWSIYDQRRRCRVCFRRLGLAAHVGCPGCLLLNWAGTELVCVDGHGMLHVPEMASCWHEPERWTALDESWLGLFARRP